MTAFCWLNKPKVYRQFNEDSHTEDCTDPIEVANIFTLALLISGLLSATAIVLNRQLLATWQSRRDRKETKTGLVYDKTNSVCETPEF